MIEDLRELPSGTAIDADVCLIGAGAAGITIARELSGSTLRVCLIEGGGELYEYPQSQSFYRGDNVGVPISFEGGRLRYLGGSTNHWGGRCAPLDGIDFRRREWIPNSGWPIDRAELDSYYLRAQKIAGFASPWLPDPDTLSKLKVVLPTLNPQWLKPFVWHYTPAMKGAHAWKWADAYQRELRESANIRTLLHANFSGLSAHENGTRARHLTVTAINGVTATISARNFVLCCGGIENARLLLLAAEKNGGGFGNDNDLVGRYFMQHSRGPAGLVVSNQRLSRVQEQFNILRAADGCFVEIGLTMVPKILESERLLNCSAVLQYQGDQESGLTAAQDIWRALLEGHWPADVGAKVGRIVGDFGAFAQGLEHRLAAGRSLALEGSAGIPSRSAVILLDIEQAPDPDSRISLSKDRDALGLRRAQANWRFGELERRTARKMMDYIAVEFARLGIGRCRIEPWLLDERIPMADALQETYHHIGTTRMGDDRRSGVVGGNCAVHGMENLYVAGSSVFPTAGQANPTFTIVALAIRLADRLKAIGSSTPIRIS